MTGAVGPFARALAAWLVASAGCGGEADPLPLPPPPTTSEEASEEAPVAPISLLEGLSDDASAPELFERAAVVFFHPRCAGCHPDGDRPTWHVPSVDGAPQIVPHAMNVVRGEDGRGAPALRCETCHQQANVPAPHQPPGAPNWHLAPAPMGWAGRDPGGLCRQLKDTARTGGRSVEAVIQHIGHDPLVAWAWDPGPGRQPAPGRQAELLTLLQRWWSLGGGCPSP